MYVEIQNLCRNDESNFETEKQSWWAYTAWLHYF